MSTNHTPQPLPETERPLRHQVRNLLQQNHLLALECERLRDEIAKLREKFDARDGSLTEIPVRKQP